MKKLITYSSRVALTMLLFFAGFSQASAGATWIGNSYIYVNGSWFTGSGSAGEWTSGEFKNHNFGEISSLILGGQIQVAANGENWGSGVLTMHYTFDNNESGWKDIILYYESYGYGEYKNNMRYQSGGSNFNPLSLDLSELSAGEHTISIFFGPLDGHYDGKENNYVAYFTIPSTQSVTVTNASYATYVSSYPLDYTNTDIKAYTAKVNTSTGTVVLSQINKVAAGVPVVLYKEGGKTENIPVCFTATDTPDESNLLVGKDAEVATSDGNGNFNYILNNVSGIGFYKANNQIVASNRAYLQTNFNVAAQGARMTMVFADEATGITSNGSKVMSKNRYFDLHGRYVTKTSKGLYILNGKTIVIK